MVEPRLFVGTDVIAQVAAALPKRGPTRAAVAYLTLDHLNLGLEDAIAVNASVSAVRAGATDPGLIRSLLERDVVVVNQPRLHAKAIIRGSAVAIGSANLSRRSLQLEELMWLTRDPVLHRRTSKWVDDLLAPAPMRLDEVTELIKLYRKDAVPGSDGGAGGHEPAGTSVTPADPFAPASVGRLWLWRQVLHAGEDPAPNEPGAGDTTGLRGKEWILNAGVARTQDGDVWLRMSSRRLNPPRRVLKAKSRAVAADGTRWTLVGYRPEDKSAPIPAWVTSKYGAKLAKRDVLVDPEDVPALMKLWAPKDGA